MDGIDEEDAGSFADIRCF